MRELLFTAIGDVSSSITVLPVFLISTFLKDGDFSFFHFLLGLLDLSYIGFALAEKFSFAFF